jgi:hypothetical protein
MPIKYTTKYTTDRDTNDGGTTGYYRDVHECSNENDYLQSYWSWWPTVTSEQAINSLKQIAEALERIADALEK